MSGDTTVAVLGMGAMGARIAQRLLAHGFAVTVWNRTAARCAPLVEAGARAAATPAAAAGDADFVLTMLTDDAASRAVWLGADGAATALPPDAVAVEASTVSAGWVHELAGHVPALVEAPVVGSRPQAEAGGLVVLGAGESGTLGRCGEVFAAFAARVENVGELGRGSCVKLVVNAFFAAQVAAAAEALCVARAAGLAVDVTVDLLGRLPVTAPPIAMALRGMAAGAFTPLFPIELVAKDLALYRELVNAQHGSVPVGDAVRGCYAAAQQAGFGADNIHGVVRAMADDA